MNTSSSSAASGAPADAAEPLQVACASCGKLNRVPAGRTGDDPRCGRCKESLFPGRPVVVTDATWSRTVERAPLPVLVDFWAPWCGPCRAIAPVLDQIAAARRGSLLVVKLEVDGNPRTAARFGVRSIPTMVILRDGRELDRIVGAMPRYDIEARLDHLPRS